MQFGLVATASVSLKRILFVLVPPNGLVIYCGTIVTEEGKEKKVNIDFEPFKPINTSLYLCDNKVCLYDCSCCLSLHVVDKYECNLVVFFYVPA